MKAIYVSVWDEDIVCESICEYNPKTKEVTDIEDADNCEDVDNADMKTDEYVLLTDETELRESDGVTFNY